MRTNMEQRSILNWITLSSSKKQQNQSNGGNVKFVHPAEALQLGHIVYVVKFLGHTEVDQPKGFDVVKQAMQKIKFSEHLKRAEGVKPPKVELTISIDGVAIKEPKAKGNLHQFPLHKISYVADDRNERSFFAFIAKASDPERHICFVFLSDKLAEEITLTIGQAFDLAYHRFLETSGRDLETARQLAALKKRVAELEQENQTLKSKLSEYESSKKSLRKRSESSDLSLTGSNGLPSLPPPPLVVRGGNAADNHHTNGSLVRPPLTPAPVLQPAQANIVSTPTSNLFDTNFLDMDMGNGESGGNMAAPHLPTVGRKLENLSFDDLNDDAFDPRAPDPTPTSMALPEPLL